MLFIPLLTLLILIITITTTTNTIIITWSLYVSFSFGTEKRRIVVKMQTWSKDHHHDTNGINYSDRNNNADANRVIKREGGDQP